MRLCQASAPHPPSDSGSCARFCSTAMDQQNNSSFAIVPCSFWLQDYGTGILIAQDDNFDLTILSQSAHHGTAVFFFVQTKAYLPCRITICKNQAFSGNSYFGENDVFFSLSARRNLQSWSRVAGLRCQIPETTPGFGQLRKIHSKKGSPELSLRPRQTPWHTFRIFEYIYVVKI